MSVKGNSLAERMREAANPIVAPAVVDHEAVVAEATAKDPEKIVKQAMAHPRGRQMAEQEVGLNTAQNTVEKSYETIKNICAKLKADGHLTEGYGCEPFLGSNPFMSSVLVIKVFQDAFCGVKDDTTYFDACKSAFKDTNVTKDAVQYAVGLALQAPSSFANICNAGAVNKTALFGGEPATSECVHYLEIDGSYSVIKHDGTKWCKQSNADVEDSSCWPSDGHCHVEYGCSLALIKFSGDHLELC